VDLPSATTRVRHPANASDRPWGVRASGAANDASERSEANDLLGGGIAPAVRVLDDGSPLQNDRDRRRIGQQVYVVEWLACDQN
jgi:hypothetical protein